MRLTSPWAGDRNRTLLWCMLGIQAASSMINVDVYNHGAMCGQRERVELCWAHAPPGAVQSVKSLVEEIPTSWRFKHSSHNRSLESKTHLVMAFDSHTGCATLSPHLDARTNGARPRAACNPAQH